MAALISSPRGKTLLLVLTFIIATAASILFNVPVLRQILGFSFLTFMPGLLLISVLRFKGLSQTEKILLSVGLSISSLILFGLLINSIYPLLGFDRPLSTISLTISFSFMLFILGIIAYLRNSTLSFDRLFHFEITASEKTFLIIPIFFPLMSILGMYLMNRYDNNIMAVSLLSLITLYAIFLTFWHNRVPSRVYPIAVFLISISLVLLLGLRGSHLIGIDTHIEYLIFQHTLQNGRWQIFLGQAYEGCLSISILPTIYQSVLHIDPEYLFKTLYPILFSLAPLVVFVISRKFIRNQGAFLASLFFMSQIAFLTTTELARANIAILFFALSIMALFHRELTEFNKWILFVILSASCVLSHYTTSYIFFFLLFATWLVVKVISRVRPSEGKTNSSITGGKLVLLFVFIFLWQGEVVGAFSGAVNFIVDIFRSMPQFFLREARGETAAAALGLNLGEKGIAQKLEFIFSWLTVALVAVGILAMLVRYLTRFKSVNSRERRPPQYLSRDFDDEFFVMSAISVAILAVSLALPFIFAGYDIQRTYMQMTIILSVFLVVGGMVIAGLARIKRAYLLILIVLIPYFLCTTGTMYQAFGSPRSLALNSDGMQYDMLYVHDQEIAGAKWLAQYGNLSEVSTIEVDAMGDGRLSSEAGISPNYISAADLEQPTPVTTGYIFLTYTNVVKGMYFISAAAIEEHNLEQPQDLFSGRNKIYSDGGAEIWQ